MPWKVAGAVLALVVGLGCSACGSFLLNGIAKGSGSVTAVTTATQSAPAMRLLVNRSGSGFKSLGTFEFRGRIHFTVECHGTGEFNIFWLSRSSGSTGGGGGGGRGCTHARFSPTPRFHGGHRIEFSVAARADVHWTVTIWDRSSS